MNKKHKVRWMKKPMAIPEVILELQDESSRESALRCLSTFLVEVQLFLKKREEDPDNYDRTGCFLYNSCGTMTILSQVRSIEVLAFLWMMATECPSTRASKRLINVLTLFQCVAANQEVRHGFVKSYLPNFLIPLIMTKTSFEGFENIRAVALSVIGILCQTREPKIIQWALQSNMVEVCLISIEIGNDLSKVIGMHILEAVLQNKSGISYICNPMHDHLLRRLMRTSEHLVNRFTVGQDFSPRLLFHIIRCYALLCTHMRGFIVVMKSLPDHIKNGSLVGILEDFPVIRSLLQLLLIASEINDCCSISLPS